MDYETVQQVFSEKETVMVFDDEQYLDWGNIHLDPRGILLSSLIGRRAEGMSEYFYPYSELSFIAQDGFKYSQVEPGLVTRISPIKVCWVSLELRGREAIRALLGQECPTVNRIRERHQNTLHFGKIEESIKHHQNYVETVKKWFANPPKEEPTEHRSFCFGDPIILENIVNITPLNGNLILTQNTGAKAILSRKADLYHIT